ncbi:hypothetical protein [Natrialba sp. INN-245]|uniref:hypothetical protein n=1 Tax=Natrialba sp. INN-245 TaxID=2690967 RepID=UPI001312FCE1|nr:hypothetical protein [Natrialba sp. INN-245]MWV38570.1 hypothetical protein [Natrialba sp. INN-245]
MHRYTLLAIVVSLAVLAGTAGPAAATPGEGPPNDLPEPVPDFVSDLIETISGFVDAIDETLGTVGSAGTTDVAPPSDGGPVSS